MLASCWALRRSIFGRYFPILVKIVLLLVGMEFFITVGGETLAVFSLPQIKKNCQCLDGQVDKIFLDHFSKLNDYCGPMVTTTVVGETLAVFSLPQIRKNCQCLDGQVGKTFLEIFGGNYNF